MKKSVTFGSVTVGQTFEYNGEEYTKTDKAKVSCCKFINATSLNDPNKKLGVKDGEVVEVSE